MELIDQLTHYVNIFLYILLIILAICGAFFFYYKKIRKANQTKEDLIDYSNLDRRDSIDYIKIDDIKDNMIILEGNRRFIGVIRCRGFNFYSAQIDEQAATISNFLAFTNTINKPISYRQYCKSVDLEDTLKMYEDAHVKVQEELFSLTEELKDIRTTLKKPSNMERYQLKLFEDTEVDLINRISALEFREFHLRSQMGYIENISGNSVAPEINETWVFDWTFDQSLFSVELSEEDIYKRAISELNAIAQAKIHSLSTCNVKAVRCKTEELIEMFRRYSSPNSADRYKLKDILSSSYFDDITSSSEPYNQITDAEVIKKEEEELRLREEELKEQQTLNELAKKELEELRIRSKNFEEELWKRAIDTKERQSDEKSKKESVKDKQEYVIDSIEDSSFSSSTNVDVNRGQMKTKNKHFYRNRSEQQKKVGDSVNESQKKETQDR